MGSDNLAHCLILIMSMMRVVSVEIQGRSVQVCFDIVSRKLHSYTLGS